MKTFILLYQCGLANVFDADTKKRVLQHAFAPCESFCRGAAEAGASITVMHWDGAGDAAAMMDAWKPGPGSMFLESKVCA